MLKKTITYTDYDGVERTEDFYFNLSKAEIMTMEMETTGGMQKRLEKIANEKDNKHLFEMFRDIILRAYGEKSLDGKRFIKSQELSDAFAQTEAYTELFMELLTDEKAMAAFVNGIIPQSLAAEAAALAAKQAGDAASMPALRPVTSN